jgi:hypothetical protein
MAYCEAFDDGRAQHGVEGEASHEVVAQLESEQPR